MQPRSSPDTTSRPVCAAAGRPALRQLTPTLVASRRCIRVAADSAKQPAAAAAAPPAGPAAAAAAADSSGSLAAALAARTEVVDLHSDPQVVAAKAQQLAAIGPTSWGMQLLMRAFFMPVWAGLAVTLLKRYAARPMAALRPPNPSRFKLVPPFPLHEEFISVNGIKLHAVSPGRRCDKPLMLMVHGFPECWYSWRHQMAAFADDWDVVAIDMRGYNTSDKPRGVDAYQLHRLAADVKAAVAALGHSRCGVLMAHDWGGSVAWVVAGLYGSALVERLVVLALPHLGVGMTNMSAAQRQRSMYMLMFQMPLLPELLISGGDAELLGEMFSRPPNGLVNAAAFSADDAAWFRAAMCEPGAATAALNYYRALWGFMTGSDRADPAGVSLHGFRSGSGSAYAAAVDARAPLAPALVALHACRALRRPLDDMPALVLHGDEDMALGVELLDGIEAAVPQVTVKLLKRCSHWVQQDYPNQVTGIIAAWLRQHGGGGSAAS